MFNDLNICLSAKVLRVVLICDINNKESNNSTSVCRGYIVSCDEI